jgi:hypothetical protein
MTNENKINDDTLIGTIHDENYSKLKTGIENRVAEKINNKIEIAKEEIIDQVTGR